LLNFSFWSELGDTIDQVRYAVTFDDGIDGKGKGVSKEWTGYWSLPAAVNRGSCYPSEQFWI
ncbi:queuosine salvage family protein, partial [Rhizobium johnstonii]